MAKSRSKKQRRPANRATSATRTGVAGSAATRPGASSARARGTDGSRPAAVDQSAAAALARQLPEVGWWAVVTGFFLLLVVYLPNGGDVFDLPKLTVLWIIDAVGLAALVGMSVAQRRWLPFVRLAIPALVLFALYGVATVRSLAPTVSFLGHFGRWGGLVTMASLLVWAALIIGFTWNDPERLRSLAVAGAAAAVVGAIPVYLARFGLSPVYQGQEAQPVGTMGNSNFAGAHLAMALPLVLYLRARSTDPRWRWALSAETAFLALGVVLTNSRGGMLAALAGVAVVGLLDDGIVHRWVARVFAGLTVIGFVVVALIGVTRSSAFMGPLANISLFRSTTLEQRAGIWHGAVDVVKDNPVIGTGPDTFALTFPPVTPRDMPGRPEQQDEPHNIVLARATDAGIPAALAMVTTVVMAFTYALRQRRREAPGSERYALVALFAGWLTAYLAQGMVSIDTVPLAMLGWTALAGLAVLSDPGAVRARARLAEEPPMTPGRVPVWLAAVLAGAVVVVTFFALVPLRADLAVRDGAVLIEQAKQGGTVTPSALMNVMDRAVALNPLSAHNNLRAGQAAIALAELGSHTEVTTDGRAALERFAEDRLRRSDELEPGFIETRYSLVDLFQGQGRRGDASKFERADEVARGINTYDPYSPLAHLTRADLLLDWSKATKRSDLLVEAKKETDLGAQYSDQWISGWQKAATLYIELGDVPAARRAIDEAERVAPGDAQTASIRRQIESAERQLAAAQR